MSVLGSEQTVVQEIGEIKTSCTTKADDAELYLKALCTDFPRDQCRSLNGMCH